MHFELKSISEQSIPEALAKVERYRLLNEPSLAKASASIFWPSCPTVSGADFASAGANRPIRLECGCESRTGGSRTY